ncbi:MAG: tRNA (N(6)-L-threonylcarbamoyladenosine(37)-C(2))-methylthiotransferase MtaB [Clostridia bacterium]|nr:tRNA (N(6)-L-threonylcarbamoyladenosine(37)-C(2))-methylthiotransferase MtaB [Clostridia bacterium]
MEVKFAVYTLGCKVNQYESEAIAEELLRAGLVQVAFEEMADIYLVNTCSVTAEGERKVRQIIRRAHKNNPTASIIVTGCYAQVDGDRLAELPGVRFVCGNLRKMRAAEVALSIADGSFTDESATVEVPSLTGADFEPMTIRRSERTRAYLKIEDGCESRCAYCIIPRARGPIRSKPMVEVVEEARALVNAGYREIVLTGIEISAYGKDLPETLPDLLHALDNLPGLERIRLGSLDPSLLTPAYTEGLKDIRHLAHHFHLSLQSGCDRTLNAMRRRYNTAMVRRNVDALRAAFPDACFTADVIVGFPGETEEDFQNTAAFIGSLDLLDCHIFPYSIRPGTEAATMGGQLPGDVKEARVHALEAVIAESHQRVLTAQVGKILPVLFEEERDGLSIGHTASFLEVAIPSNASLHGQILAVKLTAILDNRLTGEIVPSVDTQIH